MKEKLREVWEKYGEDISVGLIAAGTGLIGLSVGQLVGYRKAAKDTQRGLNALVLIKPELKPMIEEAAKELQKRLG